MPSAAERRRRNDRLCAGHDGRGLAIALLAARNVDVEQMDLVVARDAAAALVEHEATPQRRAPAPLRRGSESCRRRSTCPARARSDRGTPGSALRRGAPRPSTLSASLRPMIAKFSGSAASTAPCACARSSSPRAAARFAATSGLEVIWMTAATDIVSYFPVPVPAAPRL